MFDAAPTRRPSYRSLVREAWSGLTDWPAAPSRDGLPDGRGQPVLVVRPSSPAT